MDDFPVPVSERSVVVRPGGSSGGFGDSIKALVFFASAGAGVALAWSLFGGLTPGFFVGAAAALGLGGILSSILRVVAQWEKALVFRLGKFSKVRGPGLFFLVPFVETARLVDTRVLTLEIPHRQAITKDNVPVRVDGVIFMRVDDPSAAVIRVQNYFEAVQEYAQTALRDIVGSTTLDDLLTDREQLGKKVQEMVTSEIDGWGLEVAAIRIQDIELPEDLKRVMARQASAEREKRATITKAEGDREAAENLAAAATQMATSPGALQLRTLQTLDGLGSSQSNTVVLALPTEVFNALKSVPQLADALAGTQVDVEEQRER